MKPSKLKQAKNIVVLSTLFLTLCIAAMSTPSSIFYGIYLWSIEGAELKVAAWEGVKLFAGMFLCVIPGVALSIIYRK